MFTFHSLYSQQKYLQPKKERWTRKRRNITENKDNTRDKNRGREGVKTEALKANFKENETVRQRK
jgi:hypothetical protein